MAILAADKVQYQHEQDQLLKTILDLRFFNPWRNITRFQDNRSLRVDSHLELYITSTCNQKCEYCYLQKYPKLYPAEYNKPEIILNNLDTLFKYIISKDFYIPTLDLFSGEIWHNQFGWDVLEKIYNYIRNGMHIERIILTSNCSFVSDPKALQIMQQYINKFNMIGVPLLISASVDGKVIDDFERPRNDKSLTYTDEFYDILGAFSKVNNILFHPMIAPNSIKHWKENYLWWKDYIKKYGRQMSDVMLLEVRDKNWTEEEITQYCEFLGFIMDDFIKEDCKGDLTKFAKAIAMVRQTDDDPHIGGYIPWALGPTDTFTGCTICNHLTVRVGDLAICPCHRQAYDEYLYGKFIVENNEIVDIQAVNPIMAVKVLMQNIKTSLPLCTNCKFNYCCLRGCLGSQLETEKDPFMPIETICNFFKAKYTYLFKYYNEHGVIDFFKEITTVEPGCDNIFNLLIIDEQLKKEGII